MTGKLNVQQIIKYIIHSIFAEWSHGTEGFSFGLWLFVGTQSNETEIVLAWFLFFFIICSEYKSVECHQPRDADTPFFSIPCGIFFYVLVQIK